MANTGTTLKDQISAKNRAEVEAQTAPDQMWQSMSNQYDQRAQQLKQAYDQAYSKADNQLLSRGMGRSSYGAQVLANVNQQGIEAQSQNHSDLIAAYQNWLANYNTQQEQFQWEKDQAAQQIAMSYISAIAAKGGKPSDALLAQAGLSRSDYNAMKYKAPSGGGGSSRGGGSYRPTTTNPTPGDETGDDTGDDIFNTDLGDTSAPKTEDLKKRVYPTYGGGAGRFSNNMKE